MDRCADGSLKSTVRRCAAPLLVLYILTVISTGPIFVDNVKATTTTHYPSSANILTGSYVSGDLTSLTNVDANYYTVRSVSSATSTTPYNPSSYNLLGPTSLVSGAISDLTTDNGVCMTFRSYFSQTSTSSLSKAFMPYRSTTGTSSSYPKTRNWNGSAWDAAETELPTAVSPIRWIRTAYSPLMSRYYEKIMVTLSDDGYLDAYVWTGSSWSVTDNIGLVGTTANAYRPFDIAYEKTNGRAMLVYGISSTDTTKDLAYRIWDGSSWSAENYINDIGHASDVQYYWVALASKPTTGANEIALIALEGTTSAGSVRAWIWDGANWGNELGLETATIKAREDIAVAYESLSGNALFVWGDDAVNRYDSRRWLGSVWEGTERIAMGPLSGDPGWITLKPDPTSNRIMLLSVDAAVDLRTADWNPTTWTAHALHDDNVDYSSQRCADGDWEPTGSKYLMVYGTTTEYVEWKTWTPVAGWSTSTSIAAANTHRWIQLRRNPRDVASDVKILGATLNNVPNLGAIKWNGTTLFNTGNSTFTSAVGTSTYECFDLNFQLFGDPSEFTSEVELAGLSNSYDLSQLVWTADSCWSMASVPVTIQLYNYNLGSYPSSGDGCISYTSSPTPNTHETMTQTIAANPQNFKDPAGNWKIKIKGVKMIGSQFDCKVDWIEYRTNYRSEYTVSTEFAFSGIANNAMILLVFTVVSQYDVASTNATIQVWSYNTGQYVTTGEGHLAYTSSPTPSTDETVIIAITSNPSYYVSSGNARIRIIGVKATNTQFQQKTNQIKLDVHSPITTATTETTVVVTATVVKGSSSLTGLAASPSPGAVNQPVTISGILQGSWSGLSGVLIGKQIQISTGWGFSTNIVTGADGKFTVTTNCPATGGMYTITATFSGDTYFTGSSSNIPNYQIVASIETILTLSHRYESGGMGGARRFYGYLKEKNTSNPVPGKTVRLTIYSGGYAYIFDVTTNSQGYYDYLFTTNSGMFTWAEAQFAGSGLYLASSSGRIYP